MYILLDTYYLIEVRETLEKELGIFAKKNISRETRIVVERSLLIVNILLSYYVDV